MSGGVIHRATVEPVATPVGARWRMRCGACTVTTPPMSRDGAELAAERHEWEHDRPAAVSGATVAGRRRGRTV